MASLAVGGGPCRAGHRQRFAHAAERLLGVGGRRDQAGVALHGVFDWSWPSKKQGHLNPSVFFGADPAQKALAVASSPIGHVDTWTSPVLFIQGDQDMNVDALETVDLAQKLRDKGVEVETLVFPGEAHDFVRHSAWQKIWGATTDFFDRHLGGGKRWRRGSGTHGTILCGGIGGLWGAGLAGPCHLRVSPQKRHECRHRQ